MFKANNSPFQTGLLVSLALHGGLWLAFSSQNIANLFHDPEPFIEIDLTRPFRLVTDPRLARRALVSGTGAPKVEVPKPGPVGGAAPQTPPKEWVLPAPETKRLENPLTAEDPPQGHGKGTGAGVGDGPGAGAGGLGGEGGGEVDLIYLTELPQMLNRGDLARNLQRFYPLSERSAGREADVLVHIHLDAAGRVMRVAVAQSAGEAFDEAARKVLSLAKFSPAKVGEKSVPVKIPMTIGFRLED